MEAKSDKNEPVTLSPIVYVQKIKEKIDQIVEKRAAAGQTVTQEKFNPWSISIFVPLEHPWPKNGPITVFSIVDDSGKVF